MSNSILNRGQNCLFWTKYGVDLASQSLQICSKGGIWMPHTSNAQSQAHSAIFQLFWPRGAFEIFKKGHFLENTLIFKRPYLRNYWAHNAQPTHARLFWTYLSENNRLITILWLEKKFGPIFIKYSPFLGPRHPRVDEILKFFWLIRKPF